MSLRLYSLVLGLLCFQNIQAQAVLMIEDQSKTGFKLVVDDYLQNEVFLEKLNFKGFSQDGALLFFEMQDGRHFSRALPKLPAGNHQYIIYEDFKGKLRLRYRGEFDKLSQSALMFSFKKEHKYQFPVIIAAQPDEELKTKQSAKTDSIKSEEAIASAETPINKETMAAAKEDMPSKDSLTSQNTLAQNTDSISIAEPKQKTEKKEEVFNFATALAKIKASNFEFDKLQMAKGLIGQESLDSEQIVLLLNSFKYDQSRLDLLKTYLEKHPKKKLDEAILNAFDYELSKQAAKKILEANASK